MSTPTRSIKRLLTQWRYIVLLAGATLGWGCSRSPRGTACLRREPPRNRSAPTSPTGSAWRSPPPASVRGTPRARTAWRTISDWTTVRGSQRLRLSSVRHLWPHELHANGRHPLEHGPIACLPVGRSAAIAVTMQDVEVPGGQDAMCL